MMLFGVKEETLEPKWKTWDIFLWTVAVGVERSRKPWCAEKEDFQTGPLTAGQREGKVQRGSWGLRMPTHLPEMLSGACYFIRDRRIEFP